MYYMIFVQLMTLEYWLYLPLVLVAVTFPPLMIALGKHLISPSEKRHVQRHTSYVALDTLARSRNMLA
jgi:hypothetical protein